MKQQGIKTLVSATYRNRASVTIEVVKTKGGKEIFRQIWIDYTYDAERFALLDDDVKLLERHGFMNDEDGGIYGKDTESIYDSAQECKAYAEESLKSYYKALVK